MEIVTSKSLLLGFLLLLFPAHWNTMAIIWGNGMQKGLLLSISMIIAEMRLYGRTKKYIVECKHL